MPASLPQHASEPPSELPPCREEEEEFVEIDPTDRYGRYADLLGRGATKKVYRAFDKEEGIEVAWNQAELPEVNLIEREVRFLKTLKHKNIIKLYSYWVDVDKGRINFITELCSGTLLSYRKQHKHVCLKEVKDWARQILRALEYLHSQSPPIIHRDLKCENIFVNCSSGKVKIGDFGLATVLPEARQLQSLGGTPEFMAPEMYEGDYDELVDVYAFGMCMLQLLTLECPYGECKSLAQVYKKISTGVKPKALDGVRDLQAVKFISRCLAPVEQRPSARDLQQDPFLRCEGSLSLMKSASVPDFQRLEARTEHAEVADDAGRPSQYGWRRSRTQRDMEVTGEQETENTILMRFRIFERREAAPVRKVEFRFDLNSDTSQSVAEEMVQALQFPQSDSIVIADKIASVIASLPLNPYSSKCNLEDNLLLPSSELHEFWPNLSTLPAGISQRIAGNQLCVAPSRTQFRSQIPSYLKPFA